MIYVGIGSVSTVQGIEPARLSHGPAPSAKNHDSSGARRRPPKSKIAGPRPCVHVPAPRAAC